MNVIKITEQIKDPIKWTLVFHELATKHQVPHKIVKKKSCYSFIWIESEHLRIVPPSPKTLL